jgi:hypothetical protein
VELLEFATISQGSPRQIEANISLTNLWQMQILGPAITASIHEDP